MKYFVRVGDTEHEVTIDGESVTVDGQSVRARAEDLVGTPITVVSIGDEVHRVLARRGEEKGNYDLSVGGHRFAAEALGYGGQCGRLQRRETAEARNQLDSLVYQTEKSLKDHGADVEAATRSHIEQALEKAKAQLESEDAAAMKTAVEELSQASHKLAEAMYAKASQQAGAGPTASSGDGAAPGDGEGKGKGKDDAVDADFEEVKG